VKREGKKVVHHRGASRNGRKKPVLRGQIADAAKNGSGKKKKNGKGERQPSEGEEKEIGHPFPPKRE